MNMWLSNLRLEGKIIEDLPNGDRKEFEIEGLYSVGDLVFDSGAATAVQIQLDNVRFGPTQLVDGPITRLAKKLNDDHGCENWADLEEYDRTELRNEAAALLDFIKGLDS